MSSSLPRREASSWRGGTPSIGDEIPSPTGSETRDPGGTATGSACPDLPRAESWRLERARPGTASVRARGPAVGLPVEHAGLTPCASVSGGAQPGWALPGGRAAPSRRCWQSVSSWPTSPGPRPQVSHGRAVEASRWAGAAGGAAGRGPGVSAASSCSPLHPRQVRPGLRLTVRRVMWPD